MIICDKSSCKYYNKIFNSKNKLYKYFRSYDYYQNLLKSSNANIVIKKRRIAYYAFISSIAITTFISLITIIIFISLIIITTKIFLSITLYSITLSLSFILIKTASHTFFISLILLLLLLSTYRVISPLLFIYKIAILKTYLIIINLYIRYASLKSTKLLYYIIISFFIIIFFIIIIKDLYESFYKKIN